MKRQTTKAEKNIPMKMFFDRCVKADSKNSFGKKPQQKSTPMKAKSKTKRKF